jgi:hypothetical protein
VASTVGLAGVGQTQCYGARFVTWLGPMASRELRDLVLLTKSSKGGRWVARDVGAPRHGEGYGVIRMNSSAEFISKSHLRTSIIVMSLPRG